MAKFKITFHNGNEETVEADAYTDHNEWIDFEYRRAGVITQQMRVRGADVKRIDREG